jgi:hypothetical protein
MLWASPLGTVYEYDDFPDSSDSLTIGRPLELYLTALYISWLSYTVPESVLSRLQVIDLSSPEVDVGTLQ